ncbi:hypothetical protein CBC_A1240 [Clostridium botulinum C str. Eklund]|nr:hypothetical protein CBC_A1240 [Clostridium botulinum C str. Eklund]NEZ48172.1 hypothetical protein [Clostridium botulinum]
MNILKDKYLLAQSQEIDIKSEGQEANIDVSVNNNNNIIFGPNYSGFSIIDQSVFPPLTINMNENFLSGGATFNSSTGYVENLGTITIEFYIPENFGGSYNMQINYVLGSVISKAMLTVNATSTEETFYQTYNWNVQNAYVFNTKVELVEGKNSIIISAIQGKTAPWIGTIVITQMFFDNEVSIQDAKLLGSSNINDGFIVDSGFGVGDVTLTITDVPSTRQYNLLISYSSPVQSNNVYVYANNIYIGEPESFQQTNISAIAYKIIPINLNQGNNSIIIC